MNLIRRLGTALGFAGFALALLWLSPESALAQATLPATASGGFPEIRAFFATVAGWLINLVAFLSMLFANMIAQLFSAGFILETGIGPTLELTWSVLRNFVNLAFVAALIVVAVMVVLDVGENTGISALKKALPKMILGIVAVNLTFFAARVVLTVSDIATVAVFSIPQAVAGDVLVQSPCQNVTSQEACLAELKEVLRDLPNLGNSDKTAESISQSILEINKKFAENQSQQFPVDFLSKDSFAQVLLMNILNFKSVINLNSLSGGADLTLSIVFSLITALLVFAIYLMLVIALIVRMIYIWLAIALAPIGIMLWVLSDIFPGLPSGSDRLSISNFLGHAFMPAMIALPMSLSMIMIYANNALTTVSGDLSTFSNIANNFHTIVWWIASIGILWVGTKDMIEKSSSYAAAATGAVSGMVENIGGSLGKLAMHTPIIPLPGGTGLREGIAGAFDFLKMPEIKAAEAQEATRTRMQEKYSTPRAPSVQMQRETAQQSGGDLNKFIDTLSQRSLTGADKLDPAALREFEEVLRKANLTPDKAKDMTVSQIVQELAKSTDTQLAESAKRFYDSRWKTMWANNARRRGEAQSEGAANKEAAKAGETVSTNDIRDESTPEKKEATKNGAYSRVEVTQDITNNFDTTKVEVVKHEATGAELIRNKADGKIIGGKDEAYEVNNKINEIEDGGKGSKEAALALVTFWDALGSSQKKEVQSALKKLQNKPEAMAAFEESLKDKLGSKEKADELISNVKNYSETR